MICSGALRAPVSDGDHRSPLQRASITLLWSAAARRGTARPAPTWSRGGELRVRPKGLILK